MGLLLNDVARRAPEGIFHLRVFHRGRLIEECVQPNLVVNGSRTVHALLLGGSFTGNNVAQIGFGTGLLAPVSGNTGLTAPYMKSLDSVTWPASGQVAFAFSLGSAEANGMAIGEFGLFTTAGVLYARKTRVAALAKDIDIALAGSWTVTF